MIMRLLMKWWVKRHYGEMCKSYDDGCPQCYAWLSYYYLFDDDSIEWDDKTERWVLVVVADDE